MDPETLSEGNDLRDWNKPGLGSDPRPGSPTPGLVEDALHLQRRGPRGLTWGCWEC